MEKPLIVEVIAYAPTAFYHCTHCEVVWREANVGQTVHQEQLDASLPDDLSREYQQISDWVIQIFQQYQNRISLKVIDAASIEGMVKSLRYGVHRYPAVIVDHHTRINWSVLGADRAVQAIDAEIARCLG